MSIKKNTTISDVAQRAGVSIATVSRVLNGTTPVVPETAGRVRVAVAELHFIPRPAARMLASRRTNTIGLILSEIGGVYFPPLLKGVEAEARARGYELLIHSTQGAGVHQREPLGEHNTDGLLVFTDSLNIAELKRLNEINFPVVLLHQSSPDGLNIPAIAVGNKDGAEMVASHLIATHGRRRIVFMRGPEGHEDSLWRERGYREALQKHNISDEIITDGGFDEEIAFQSLQKLMADGVAFDAVFAGDDNAAMGVYRALKHANRLIPDDVAVVGFDDVQFARYISPPLTTIRAPIEEVGREAVRQLKYLMDGDPAQSLVLMRAELVIRQSCGCPSKEGSASDMSCPLFRCPNPFQIQPGR